MNFSDSEHRRLPERMKRTVKEPYERFECDASGSTMYTDSVHTETVLTDHGLCAAG